MREDTEGDGEVDVGRNPRKGESVIGNQLGPGQAVLRREFHLIAPLHQRKAGIGGPVVAGVEEGHRLAPQPQRPRADVKQAVMRTKARVPQDLHLDAPVSSQRPPTMSRWRPCAKAVS